MAPEVAAEALCLVLWERLLDVDVDGRDQVPAHKVVHQAHQTQRVPAPHPHTCTTQNHEFQMVLNLLKRNVSFHTSMVQVKLFHTFSLVSHVLQKLDKHSIYFTPNKFPSGNFTQPTFISHAHHSFHMSWESCHIFSHVCHHFTCAWLYITRQCVAMRLLHVP